MKHLFIVNPTAGGKDSTSEVRAKVEEAFSTREGQYEIYVTRAPLDATEKIKAEAGTGEHIRAYACGGDGTFNECISGAVGCENVAVAPFPTGTGNDFCRMFGDEMDLYRDAGALLDGFEHPIDIIHCNGRYSANICSVGIDARIGTSVHNYSKLPLIGGSTAYVVSAVVEMFRGISRHMRITSGDFVADAKHALVCACNGRFYGGGFNPSLTAMPDDGIMDIFVAKKLNILQFAALIGKYAKGRADELPQFVTHLRTDRITIEFDEDNVVNIDGEAIFTKKAELRLLPKAARLIVPAGMHFFDESLKTAGETRNKKFINFSPNFASRGLQNKKNMLLYTSLALQCFEC